MSERKLAGKKVAILAADMFERENRDLLPSELAFGHAGTSLCRSGSEGERSGGRLRCGAFARRL